MQLPASILILGPTAGGKSDLAIDLALRLNGEIISADSMQVYRHLDAGTAKPSPAQRRQVPHHLIDMIEPTDRFTAADWLTQAEQLIHAIAGRNRVPIIVGGTNLYIQSLLHGMFEGPPASDALRQQLAQRTNTQLHDQLQQADPAAAQRIHINDRRRLTRAVEVYELTGRPISDWQQQWDAQSSQRLAQFTLIGLRWPVEAINRRINLRVKAMFYPQLARQQDGVDWWVEHSLIEETRQLHQADLLGPQAREALGYKQVLAHLAGPSSEQDAFEQTKIQTRRFAKQQRTWLRRFPAVHWLAADELTPAQRAQQALHVLDGIGKRHTTH